MLFNVYKDFVNELGTKKVDGEEARISWAILEMVSEASECLELVTKAQRKGNTIDKDKLWDELTDTFWGFTAIMNEAFPDRTLDDVMKYNYYKLRERHGTPKE